MLTLVSHPFPIQEQLQHHDFTKFNVLKPRLLEAVDRMLAEDIARLMAMIPVEEASNNKDNNIIRGETKLWYGKVRLYIFFFTNFIQVLLTGKVYVHYIGCRT